MNVCAKLNFSDFNDEFSDFFNSPVKERNESYQSPYQSPFKAKKISYNSPDKFKNERYESPYQSPFKDKNISEMAFRKLEIKENEQSSSKRFRLTESDENNNISILSGISNSNFESSLSMPSTPCKKRKTGITNEIASTTTNGVNFVISSEYALKLLDITKNSIHQVKTSLGNIEFEVKDWEEGTFSKVSLITSKQQIHPEYSNDQLVFSCFKPAIIEKDSNEVESYFNNKISQYRMLEELAHQRDHLIEKKSSEMLDENELQEIDEQLKKLNVPAFAKILNIETAKEDGFFIIEKIDDPFEVSFDADTQVDDLDEKHKDYLEQVKNAFAFAVEHKICLDYKKNNVGILNGKVVLFDYMERNLGLLLRFDTCVQTFATCQFIKNQNIYDYLMPESIPSRFCSKLVRSFDGNMSFKQNDPFL